MTKHSSPSVHGTAIRRSSSAAAHETAPAGEQLAAFMTLLAGAWLVVSTFFLAYPFTIQGVDARLREMGLGLAIGIMSAARIRAPRQVRSSRVLSLAAGAVLILMPFLFSYGPGGPLAVAWWNEIGTGIVVVATTSLPWGAAALRNRGGERAPLG